MSFKSRISGIVLAVSMLILGGSISSTAQDVQGSTNKFNRLLRLVDSYYVDSTNVDDLTEKAIVEVLRNLDPHSVYVSKEEVEKMNEPLLGNFEGVGISFNVYQDTLMVVTTISGGPSEKVGIRAGDRILKVDGKNIAGVGLKNADVFDYLRGKKGTKVELSVKRKDEAQLLDFTVIRDKIPINSLDASYLLNNETGYIKLNKFSATTTDEFKQAILDLKKNPKMSNLVLDLRDNGGGYLNAATELADQFLTAYRLIVYTEGLKTDKKEYNSTAFGELEQGKLIVLIDEGSASASEIVAGAIQDWDRGVIIGRRSFGKGLVQQQFPLTDGSMVRLTNAHYYTPSGRCIQKPYEKGVDEYRKESMNRIATGELFSKDSIIQNKAEKYATKVSKRDVYGGGGITPDIFIPLDTSKYYAYYNALGRKSVISNGVIDIVDTNRENFKRDYPNFESFVNKFEITDEMIEKIIAAGEKEGVKRDEKSIEFARSLMKRQMKALIARDLFTTSHYFQVMNSEDEVIKKTMEVLSKRGLYERILSGQYSDSASGEKKESGKK
jgi:carboxyl-terminal processing protease